MELDTTKLSQAGQRKLTPHDNCTVLDIGTGSFPRLIELRLPGVDGARQSALWDGSLDLAVNDLVIADEYAGQTIWRISSMGGGDSGAGKTRVNKVWASDFTSESLVTDASDNITINTGTLTLPSDIIHLGDIDTKISLTDDDVEIFAGNLSMLKLTEAAQDLITLGPGSGDVDIDFNGDAFLRGSDGNFGINTTTPIVKLEIASTGNNGERVSAYSTTTTFAGEGVLQLLKSHNASIGTLTETVNGERLGRMDILGVDSNDVARSTAGFRATQVGAASAGNVPSAFDLVAANNIAVMRLDEGGDVVIANGATPAALGQLHVDQTGSTAAQPVLYLDQADVSEAMIQFETTIGTGNAIEAVGAKTLTPTHFLKCILPGGLTRYCTFGTIA